MRGGEAGGVGCVSVCEQSKYFTALKGAEFGADVEHAKQMKHQKKMGPEESESRTVFLV